MRQVGGGTNAAWIEGTYGTRSVDFYWDYDMESYIVVLNWSGDTSQTFLAYGEYGTDNIKLANSSGYPLNMTWTQAGCTATIEKRHIRLAHVNQNYANAYLIPMTNKAVFCK